MGPGFETGRAMQKSESSKGRPSEKKRRHRNVEGPQSPKNAKRPRRSLIEDYLTVVDKDKDQKENGKEEAEEEEAEYEVETIVGFKKSEVTFLLVQVLCRDNVKVLMSLFLLISC